MAKMTEYSAVTDLASDEILLLDGSRGTKKIVTTDLLLSALDLIAPENHAAIYRGKNLGTSFTDEQASAISSGKFTDIFVGDYWTDGSIKWAVADINYWYNCGDTAFTKPHVVIVPLSYLYTHCMNESNTTEGGYTGSLMYTEGLESAKESATAFFGDHVLTHREYLTNAVTGNYASAGAWFDSSVELMNEIMLYGTRIYGNCACGTNVPNLYTTEKSQLALFRLVPKLISNRQSSWLRDVVSSTAFAAVYYNGDAGCYSASSVYGVRPVFPVG